MMDFGLAKVESPDQDRTVTRLQAGTISYMSPEQVRGLQHVSQLSDIYSLGKTFYHILARRLPFNASESDQYSILKAIIERQFKPPSHFNKEIPRGLDKIIMKAIEKDPSNRFQSAREMYQALAAYEKKTTPKPVSEKSPPKFPVTLSWPSLTRKQWILGAMSLLVFFSLTAFASWYNNRDALPRQHEQTNTTTRGSEQSSDHVALKENGDTTNGSSSLTGSPASASISIVSSPENSTITLGNEQFESPLTEYNMEAGEYALLVESDGYDTYSATLDIHSDTTISINLLPQGTLIVESSVPGALVTVNGNRLGTAPINQRMAQGTYAVVVSADGYSTFRSQIRVRSGNEARLEAPLQIQGTLRVSTTPGSDIFIDDNKQQVSGNTGALERNLAPGTYQLRISHPEHGLWEKEITVDESEQNMTIDFTQRIQANISANIFGASIYIDGVQTQEETPGRLELGVGVRRIEVRRTGYSSDPAYIDYLVEGNETPPLQFSFQLSKEE